jgi:predicted ribosome quality control (RQC) complex YloA/Tae2 family protein
MGLIRNYSDFLLNENLINAQLKQFGKDGIHIKHKKIIDDLNIDSSYDVYWGGNKHSNHFLTSNFCGKHAKSIGGISSSSQDIWLHASGYPGSHVLIKAIKDDIIPNHILKKAAEIAKKNSKAKDIQFADVVWCYKDNVSIYPPLEVENKIKELQNKLVRTKEEEDFIESNQPSIGRAFIENKDRNIIHI